jgi:hypothetical protein
MRDMRGFYDKFRVIRRETGQEETGPTFTLLPDHDQHALVALLAYAESCEGVNPELASDLRQLVTEFS